METIRHRITVSILVLMLLAIMTPFALVGYWKHQIRSEIAEIKARGEPITTADLASPKIPDSENGAVVYQEAFQCLSGADAESDLDVLKGLVRLDKPSDDPKLWEGARQVLPKYQRVVDLAEKASYRPKCRFSADWSKGIEAKFPYLGALQKLGYILCANSLVNAKDGHMDEAVRSLRTGFELANALEDEPSLIAMVVRKAIIHSVSSTLSTVTMFGDLTPEQARGLYEILDTVDLAGVYPRVLAGERATGIDLFDRSRRRESGYVWTPFLNGDEVVYLRLFSRQLEMTQLSYREALKEDNDCQPKRWQKYALMSAIVSPDFSHVRRSRDEAIVEIAGDKVLLALLAYHRRFGSYPTDVAQLRAKLGWAIPADPFTGKDFIYKRKGKGFLLYSIGPNLRDDGGVIPREKKSIRDEGDIVWEFDH